MIRRGIGVQSFAAVAGGYTPSDADALAFVNAAEITNDTQKQAINTLVTDLKGYGIWSKMKAIWPFVGGTSSTHKWNLKDPRDLDAAFRLVFSGGGTHSSTGYTPNGVNGYADTKFYPSLFTANNAHLTFYSRSNSTTGTMWDIGANGNAPTYQPGYSLTMANSFLSPTNQMSAELGEYDKGVKNNVGNYSGFGAVSRTANNSLKLYRNGTLLNTNTSTNTITATTNNIYIGALNLGGTADRFSNRQCAFASVGDGLTDTEAANLYTAVQAYQTTLSRNV